MHDTPSFPITVAARKTPLSKAQVTEVLEELSRHHPEVEFMCILAETQGDKDLKTSLRTLGKSDFFAKEVNDLVLDNTCEVSIHSAKDLPHPLPEGLNVIALTKGVDSSDSLVLRPGETLQGLKAGSVIATSSERREEIVRSLRADLTFVDIRGPIHQRLAQLDSGSADGVVVAEAALIRLNLTHLNRIRLPGDTVPGQGQLAVVARMDNSEMAALFATIDSRTL